MKLGVACLLLALPASAQGPPAAAGQQAATFKTSTTLLTLDVTALDRDGRPVAGLRPSDFEVRINGSVQPVQTLAFIQAKDDAAATALPERSVSASFPRRTAFNASLPMQSRVFVIVVDDLSFEPGAGKALFVSAEDFVSRLPAADFIGFALSSGKESINPSRARRPVIDALKRAVGAFSNPANFIDPPMVGIGEAFEIAEGPDGRAKEVMLRECFSPQLAQAMSRLSVDRLRSASDCADNVPSRARQIVQQVMANRTRQLRTFESILESLKAAPGIKYVVLLSGGVPVTRAVNDLLPVAKAAARSGVQIATMVQEGDIDLSDRPSGVDGTVNPGRAQLRRADDRVLLQGAQTLTDMAGGQFYRVIGQPHRFFERVTTSASAVYRLGIALPDGTKPGQDLSISASVRHAGVSALASRHAAAPEPEATLPPAERMVNAIKRGETLYGVPMALGAIVRRGGAPGQIEIGTVITVPGSIDGPLEAIVGVLDGNGDLKSGKRTLPDAADRDYSITTALPVVEGHHQLRVAIADARGNVGAVSMPIDASLHVIGDLQTSDLLTWTPDSAGRMHLLAVEDLPAGVTTLTSMLELYPRAGSPAGLAVRFALVDGSGKIVEEKIANLSPGAAMVRADAQFEVASLPPGHYVVRADVTVAGRTAGNVTTAVSKR